MQNADTGAESNKKKAGVEFVPGQVLVRFRPNSAVADQSDSQMMMLPMRTQDGRDIPVEVTHFGGSELVEGLRLALVPAEDTLRAVEALNARLDVEFAEPNYIWGRTALPNDTQFGDLWALKNTGQTGNNDVGCPPGQPCPQPGVVGEDIDAEVAWNSTTGNRSVVVAILDGGVDITHPDLQPNIWTNPGEVPNNGLDDDTNGFIDDINGWDFHNRDKTVFDAEEGDDHGTHVAGTIGAVGNNGQGVTGINWQVSIMSVKVLGPSGGSTSNIISGYNYVRLMREQRGINVRVMNNSYGGPGFSQSAFLAVQQLNNAGVLFVAAAGNDAQNNFNFPHFPSDFALPNVISVAATDRFGQMAVFSNFGGRKVLMGAPGRGILSTVPAFVTAQGTITENGAKYAFFSGTSMATPHVTGSAALLLSQNPSISVQNLRGALAFSGDLLPSQLEQTTTGRRLNVAAAIASATESGGAADTIAPVNPSNLQVTSVNGRNVTLQWTAPGDDGASGTVADYDFTFLQFGGGRLILPTTIAPAVGGTTQTVTVTVPYLNQNGTIELRAYDNAGNFGVSNVSVFLGQNHLNDPYIVATNTGPQPLSTGGTSLNLSADDGFIENHPLPFGFPFYGQTRNAVTISTNGALYFSRIPREGTAGQDADSSVQGLIGQTMIAGLWDDIMTDRPNGGVFVVQPDSTRVIYRWQAVTFGRGEVPVNFEIELNSNGQIVFRYGAGQSPPTNTQLFSVVGISTGEPDAYIISSHTAGTVPLTLTNANVVTFTPRPAAPVTFTLSGRVKDGDANGIGNATVSLSGTQSRLTTTDQNGNYSFANLPAGDYTLSPSKAGQFTGFAQTINGVNSDRTVDLLLIPFIFVSGQIRNSSGIGINGAGVSVSGSPAVIGADSAGNYSLSITPMASTPVTITPVKFGYTFIPQNVTFNNANVGNQVGVNFTGTLGNPIDGSQAFVRQHYLDFLGREPDASGLAFWTQGIELCGPSLQCVEVKRVDTSAAFFLSIEFQNTGFFVYRIYKSAYGDGVGTATVGGVPTQISVPIVRRDELIPDTRRIGQGVVVGVGDWAGQLDANKNAYTLEFVATPRFVAEYPAMSPTAFVDQLNQKAGNPLTSDERLQLIAELEANNSNAGRASVLRKVAENSAVGNAEFNRAFVLMQYFGYLRRNPNDAPDTNYGGFNFWLGKLNQFNGNFAQAGMVSAFISSIEYRQRFGP